MDKLPRQFKLCESHSCPIASVSYAYNFLIVHPCFLPLCSHFHLVFRFVLGMVNAASTNQLLEITSIFLEAETVLLFYKKLWKFPLQNIKAVEIHACCFASASAS